MIRLCSLVELANYLNVAKLRKRYVNITMVHLLSIDAKLIVLLMLFQNGTVLTTGGILGHLKVLVVSIGRI